jgi:hypothetical protein
MKHTLMLHMQVAKLLLYYYYECNFYRSYLCQTKARVIFHSYVTKLFKSLRYVGRVLVLASQVPIY